MDLKIAWKRLAAGAAIAALQAAILSTAAPGGESCGTGAELKVGSGTARPGEQVEVPVWGKSACGITGFSFAVGHDGARLEFLTGRPSPFISGHAGSDLVFQTLSRNGDGYAAIFAIFDVSDPITVPPLALPAGTLLATIVYRVLPGAPAGPAPLLNRDLYYGAPNYVSNVFSLEPGQDPIDPALVDGAVQVLPPESNADFLRGDANHDGKLDIADPIWVLSYLFVSGRVPPCPDSADSNDDGRIDISDAIYALAYMFTNGPIPPPPFPEPGPDLTSDQLGDCLE